LLKEEWDIFNKYQKALCVEEEIWRLKSQILWLTNGYTNTNFFHKQAKARPSRNHVKEIKIPNGELTSSFD